MPSSVTAAASITPRARRSRCGRAPEPQPRGARVHGNRPIDQAEAAARFIAAPEHEKMHDERLWDLRQKRDREMHGIPEWEELRSLASAIKEHTLTHLDEYLEQFEANARSNGDPRALGARRRRAQPDRPRHPARPRRYVADQEQVDAHRGVRLSALHGLGRDRGDRDRSRRAHPAARQRGSEPCRRAGRAQAAHRRGRGILAHDRHRP